MAGLDRVNMLSGGYRALHWVPSQVIMIHNTLSIHISYLLQSFLNLSFWFTLRNLQKSKFNVLNCIDPRITCRQHIQCCRKWVLKWYISPFRPNLGKVARLVRFIGEIKLLTWNTYPKAGPDNSTCALILHLGLVFHVHCGSFNKTYENQYSMHWII